MNLEKNVEILLVNGLKFTKNNLKDWVLLETGITTIRP